MIKLKMRQTVEMTSLSSQLTYSHSRIGWDVLFINLHVYVSGSWECAHASNDYSYRFSFAYCVHQLPLFFSLESRMNGAVNLYSPISFLYTAVTALQICWFIYRLPPGQANFFFMYHLV
jgi:hypothetical protein